MNKKIIFLAALAMILLLVLMAVTIARLRTIAVVEQSWTHANMCYELRADLVESDYDSGNVIEMLQANGCDYSGIK